RPGPGRDRPGHPLRPRLHEALSGDGDRCTGAGACAGTGAPPPRPVPPERDSRIARLLPRVAALGADPRAPGSADGAAAAGGDGGARAVAGLLGTDHQLLLPRRPEVEPADLGHHRAAVPRARSADGPAPGARG